MTKAVKKDNTKDQTLYSVEEAVSKVKSGTSEKFNATVEAHINLNLDVKKQDQMVRFSVTLPHGTGKSKKVAVLASKKAPAADLQLTEADLERIEKGELRPKVDFDVLVAEPRFMVKLAKVAKVLGPAGAMPNPKTGTVTEDVEKAVELIKKGKVDIKTEKDAPVIHTIVGKTQFEEKDLVENLNELLSNLKQSKPGKSGPDWVKSIVICSTMGQPYRLDVSEFQG